jgi:Uri superfamily endonuclease
MTEIINKNLKNIKRHSPKHIKDNDKYKWYIDNIPGYKEQKYAYAAQKVLCDCGCSVTKGNYATHIASFKHESKMMDLGLMRNPYAAVM